MLQPGEDAVEPMALLLAPFAMNLCYTAGWVAELLYKWGIWGRDGQRWSDTAQDRVWLFPVGRQCSFGHGGHFLSYWSVCTKLIPEMSSSATFHSHRCLIGQTDTVTDEEEDRVRIVKTLWPLLLALGMLVPGTAWGQAAPKSPPTAGLAGDWLGSLDTGAFKLRLLVKITGQPGALAGTMDSLDQGAMGIPMSGVTQTGDAVYFEVSSIQGKFDGKRSADGMKIVGTWTQGAASLPLALTKTDAPPAPPRRPQEPKPPYPYTTKDLTFPDAQEWRHAGRDAHDADGRGGHSPPPC